MSEGELRYTIQAAHRDGEPVLELTVQGPEAGFVSSLDLEGARRFHEDLGAAIADLETRARGLN